MSQTELLMKEIEGLSPNYMAQGFGVINQLKTTAPPDRNDEPAVPAVTFAEARQKIKALGVNLSVERMLRQKHEDLSLLPSCSLICK